MNRVTMTTTSGLIAGALVLLPVGVSAAPGPDAIPVVGTERCSVAVVSSEQVGDAFAQTERFTCTDEFSDPRLSGSWEAEIVSVIHPDQPGLAVWTMDEFVVTNSGGTWRGRGQGVVDIEGTVPFAEGLAPFNYGEVTSIGEGGYQGLRYQGYVAGTNADLGLTGWIESSD